MKVRLVAPPWGAPQITPEAEEAFALMADNVWRDACVRFYAERDAKLRAGKHAPKGMQGTLNKVLEERFLRKGWHGDSGCFYKEHTWIRITFRHQMSLGSDFLDAMKVCKKEGMELAIILAADASTLRLMTPNDAAALISFEKLNSEMLSLDGVTDIPLLIGELIPNSKVPPAIEAELRKNRPRDITVPKSVQ
ncbi:MAG: hypothetical protein LIV26_10140 [Atopobium sp.]|jgi:hypothetical protein|nr:hypothetical protein [Atopobium sp.]RRF98236.1 MAG: hypothetical protein DUD39_10675 [Coriobacteriaceae bacterium]